MLVRLEPQQVCMRCAKADAPVKRNVRRGFAGMKKMKTRGFMAVLIGLLLSCCLATVAQAAGYKDVYGKTLDRVRVRAKASLSADIEDNIVSGACVYALDTDYVGGNTFIRIRYRDLQGDIATGWVCQNDGSKTYVKMLSKADAKNYFGVEGGDLPSKRVGTFTRSDKTSSNNTSGVTGKYGYLQNGSSGSDVRRLQQKLTELGYYKGNITGSYGNLTEQAVKDFQKKAGLYDDGIAGPATQAKLFGTSSSSSSSSSSSKVNLTSSQISQLQSDLKELKLYDGSITGNYGTKTEEAVRKFQRKYGLSADGIAGEKTLDKIASVLSGSSSSGSSGTISTSSTLKLNSTGTAVRTLQQNLKTLGFYDGSVTGNYGPMTEEAVRKFQRKNDLSADGVAGKKTLEKINAAMGGGSNDGSGTSTGGSTTTLKEGSSGEAVKTLQENLKTLKYYTGSVTGSYGSLTKEAVRKFQKDNDLTADGVAGPKTLNKITAKITGKDPESGDGVITTPTLRSNYGRTNKDKVNVRTSPTGNSKTILALNTYFKINSSMSSNNYVWYNITFTVGGYTSSGYIRSDMVYVLTKSEAESYLAGNVTGGGEVVVNGYIKVTADNVRLRQEASTDSSVMGTTSKGAIYPYISTKKDGDGKKWYGLKIGSWIREDFVTTNVSDDEIKGSGSGSGGYRTLTLNMEGEDVKSLQQALRKLGYYPESKSITGRYGTGTAEAVRQFQLDHNITADAKAGPKTQTAIYAKLNSSASTPPAYGLDGTAFFNPDYFASKEAIKKAWGSGKATLYDITSGRSWNIVLQSAGNHFDVEPATADDTAVMCAAYGVGSALELTDDNGHWKRRPVLLTIGKSTFCGSMYGVVHGSQKVTNNNYPGQFCIHLKNSKTHGSDHVDDDHQAAIAKAVTWVKNNKTNGAEPGSVYPAPTT